MEEIYFIKLADNSRWVPPASSRQTRRYLAASLMVIVMLGGGLFSARQRLLSRQNGYRLEKLDQQRQELLEANRKLRLEEASLVDPSRIDWIARNELGMSTLAPNQIFRGEQPSAPVLASGREAPDAGLPQNIKLAASLQ